MKNPKPEPVVTSTACSLCGLDWDSHGDKPTAQTCIDLLRAELRKPRGMSFAVSGASTVANSSGTTLTAIRYPKPDDPDMGVPAKTG